MHVFYLKHSHENLRYSCPTKWKVNLNKACVCKMNKMGACWYEILSTRGFGVDRHDLKRRVLKRHLLLFSKLMSCSKGRSGLSKSEFGRFC